MQTQPVAPLRSVASGPAFANLDLAMAFPLADDGLSFLDRLEAAETAAMPVETPATREESTRRSEKKSDAASRKAMAKRTEVAADALATEQGRDPTRSIDHASSQEVPATRQTDTAAPQPDEGGATPDDQPLRTDAKHSHRDEARAAMTEAGEEATPEPEAAQPSMRQARLEAESPRRQDVRDDARPAGDAPADDGHGDGRSFNGSNAGPAAVPQRHAPTESFARESSAVKAAGSVQESQGPSHTVAGDRAGQARGGPHESARAKQAKRPATTFPAPQAEESTMVLRTGKALAAALRGAGDIRLNLSPEELGRVQIRMHSDQSGVSVVLGCERPETVASLESGIAALRRSLEDQGVRVKEIVVEGPRSSDPGVAVDRGSDASSNERPATGSDQGARHDREGDVPARRDPGAATRREDDQADVDTVVVDRSVGTLLASLDAAGVSTALDTVV